MQTPIEIMTAIACDTVFVPSILISYSCIFENIDTAPGALKHGALYQANNPARNLAQYTAPSLASTSSNQPLYL